MMQKLPAEARNWTESLPWQHRRYVLSLCHLLLSASPETQAEFLDDYTADGLVSKMLEDRYTKNKVQRYLKQFLIPTNLSEDILRSYIKQFYIHSAHDMRIQPDQYLESVLRLVLSVEEKNNVFNYILGFEIMKIMFNMSWLQHERLYRIQINQEDFLKNYIKPIQHAHRINGIIMPKDERLFFAKRSYFVEEPILSEKKAMELIIATFTTKLITEFGFSIMRNIKCFNFNYDYIYSPESEELFI
ncbi:MAG: cobyrinic acid a,c-diamide synthase [Hormoscilla sp.]